MTNQEHVEMNIVGFTHSGDRRLTIGIFDERNRRIGFWDGGDIRFETQEEAGKAAEIQAGILAASNYVYIKKTRDGFESWPLENRTNWPMFDKLELDMFDIEMQREIENVMRPFDAELIGTMAGVHYFINEIDKGPKVKSFRYAEGMRFIKRYLKAPQVMIDLEYKTVSVFADGSIEVNTLNHIELHTEDSFIKEHDVLYTRIFWMKNNCRALSDEDSKYLEVYYHLYGGAVVVAARMAA